MSLLCQIGLHRWKPHFRRHETPVRVWAEMLVVPSLFAGPPYMKPLFQYDTHFERIGERCSRCRRCRK